MHGTCCLEQGASDAISSLNSFVVVLQSCCKCNRINRGLQPEVGGWCHCRVMQYPGYLPLGLHEPPKVLHYGIEYRIEEPPFAFDKHWYLTFEPQQCPPWTSFNEAGRPTGGLFPNPPHPSQLKTQGLELLRDLLAIQTMATLNEALCLRHMKACPPSQELDSKCHEVCHTYYWSAAPAITWHFILLHSAHLILLPIRGL